MIHETLMQASYVFVACVFLALLEIEIEGEHGWAKNLPTWRRHPAGWHKSWLFGTVRTVFTFTTGGNELTGYHLTLMSFLIVVMAMPLVFVPPTWSLFLRCAGYFFLTTVTWDFLWFVFNPAFGIRRFKKSAIDWHPRWLGPMPLPYPGGFVLGALLIAFSAGGIADHWYVGVIAAADHAALTGLCVLGVEVVRAAKARQG